MTMSGARVRKRGVDGAITELLHLLISILSRNLLLTNLKRSSKMLAFCSINLKPDGPS